MTLDLPTLRAQRDAARETIKALDYTPWVSHKARTECYNKHLDTLLRLHAQVTTLENAEKLEVRAEFCGLGIRQDVLLDAAAFLRATVETP